MAVQLKKLVDSRIDAGASLSTFHDVIKGGANMSSQEFKAIAASTSNVDWTIQTPGLGVYMSRRVNFVGKFEIAVPIAARPDTAGVTNSRWMQWGRDFGMCSFPFNSLITNGTVQINTSNFNTVVQQSLPLWKRLLLDESVRTSLSEVPTGLTHSAVNYQHNLHSELPQDTHSAITCDGDYPTNTSTYSVSLSQIGTSLEIDASGTAFRQKNLSPAGTLIVKIDVVEPLLLQPFVTDEEEAAFINVNLMTVRINLSTPDDFSSRILRFAAANGAATTDNWIPVIGSGGVKWHSTQQENFLAAMLRCQFITPPPTDQIPTKTIYPTVYYNPLTTGNTTREIGVGVTAQTLSSNVITVNTAPDMLAVWVVPRFESGLDGDGSLYAKNNNRSVNNPGAQDGTNIVATSTWLANYPGGGLSDPLLTIKRLQIQWNNNPSLLATFDQLDLVRRSQQNGLDLPWYIYRGFTTDREQAGIVFRGVGATLIAADASYDPPGKRSTIGAPILLALNKDIPVEPGVGAGVAGVYTITVTVDVQNNLPFTSKGYSLVVCPINSQYLILNSGATSDVISTVATEQVVAAAPVSGEVQYKGLSGAGRHSMHPTYTANDRPPTGAVYERGGPGGSMIGAGNSSVNALVEHSAKRMRM